MQKMSMNFILELANLSTFHRILQILGISNSFCKFSELKKFFFDFYNLKIFQFLQVCISVHATVVGLKDPNKPEKNQNFNFPFKKFLKKWRNL